MILRLLSRTVSPSLPGDRLAVSDPDEASASALLPAGLLLGAGLAGLVVATLFSDGVDGQFVVVTPPWQSVLGVVLQADGALVAGGGFDNILIAASDRPGFAKDLRAAGAWLVFPAPRALGCGTPQQSRSL